MVETRKKKHQLGYHAKKMKIKNQATNITIFNHYPSLWEVYI